MCGQKRRERGPPFSNPKVSFHGQFTCLNTNQYIDCCVGAGGEIWCRLGKCIFRQREYSLTGGGGGDDIGRSYHPTFPFIFFDFLACAMIQPVFFPPFFLSRRHSRSVAHCCLILLEKKRLKRQLLGVLLLYSFLFFPVHF